MCFDVDFENGERAITHYHVLKEYDGYSLVSLKLETGRTHQIRVHMASIGHPLLGDDLYGGSLEKISRQALHCGEMKIKHPITDEEFIVKAKIPNDMMQIINQIR